MKHVNGDMEDLFRRAAERYPLRTDSADWDRLAAVLDKDAGPLSDADSDEKRRRRGIFWWWLLLPLAGVLGFYGWRVTVRPSTHLSKEPAAIAAPAGVPATGAAGDPATAAATGGAGTQGGAVARTGVAGTQGGGTGAGGTVTQGGGASAQAGGVSSDDVTSTERAVVKGQTTSGLAKVTGRGGKRKIGKRTIGSLGERRGVGNRTGDANDHRFDAAKMGGGEVGDGRANSGGGEVGGGVIGGEVGGGVMGGGAGDGVGGRSGLAGRSRIDSRRASTAGSFNLAVDVKAPAARKDSSAKQTKKATAKSSHGHGYIGLTGAPDLSMVKMQATKGVGTTWGLVLGYSFTDHWAVESGVSLDRKKYYTAGEYFKGETLPPYTSLQSVNGACNMWEIPLNVRYNFNPGSTITWFATTGFSSYFMTKQKYAAIEESGGVSWPYNWVDSTHSNYLFSIINLSVGFEQRIGRIGNLRIEPYLRIPLSGIGSGRLPIMSTGLNIGITRQLW